MQNHRSPLECYRELYKYHADHRTKRVNSLRSVYMLSGHFWGPSNCSRYWTELFLWVLPIPFPKLILSNIETAAFLSTWQWEEPAVLLPPSFLLQINSVLFVLALSELYFHIAGRIAQYCKMFSILSKNHQYSSCLSHVVLQQTSRCSMHITASC